MSTPIRTAGEGHYVVNFAKQIQKRYIFQALSFEKSN